MKEEYHPFTNILHPVDNYLFWNSSRLNIIYLAQNFISIEQLTTMQKELFDSMSAVNSRDRSTVCLAPGWGIHFTTVTVVLNVYTEYIINPLYASEKFTVWTPESEIKGSYCHFKNNLGTSRGLLYPLGFPKAF